jgi:hypothetical protein
MVFGAMHPVGLFRAVHVESLKNVSALRNAIKQGKTSVPVEVIATHGAGTLSQVRLVGKTLRKTTLIVPSAFITTRRKSRRTKLAKETCAFCGLSPMDYTTEEYMEMAHMQPERPVDGEVDMQESRIANVTDDIWTDGLATCTGLHFRYGTKQYLAHISAPEAGDDVASILAAHTSDVIKDIRAAPTKITRLHGVTLYIGIGGNKDDESTIMNPAEVSRKLAWAVLDKIRKATGVRIRVTIVPTCYKEKVPRGQGNLTTIGENAENENAAATPSRMNEID